MYRILVCKMQFMNGKTVCLLQIRCKAVEWHPDVATQMVLASEDDRYPVIQVRNYDYCSKSE